MYNSICGIILKLILLFSVSGFAARSITASTAKLSWRRPNEATKYYIIEVTNRNTLMSEAYYIANPATISTHIYSLHPYHHYTFSIAAFTVAKGQPVSRTIQMPQAGMDTIIMT